MGGTVASANLIGLNAMSSMHTPPMPTTFGCCCTLASHKTAIDANRWEFSSWSEDNRDPRFRNAEATPRTPITARWVISYLDV